jgi:hypothetical protein
MTDDEKHTVLLLVEDEIRSFLQWELEKGYDPHAAAARIVQNLAPKLELLVD